MRQKTINGTTRAALETVRVDGLNVELTCGELPRDEYERVAAVFDALSAVWSKSARVHVFPLHTDPAALIAGVLASGKVPLHARQADGFVPTPPYAAELLIEKMRDLRGLPRGARVLEPSAGTGDLARAVLDANRDVTVYAVEPNAARVHALRVLAADYPGQVHVYAGTFEEFADANDGELFDAVIMNPPFTVPGRAALWIDHVKLAHSLLRPGGHLVSIVPDSYASRADSRHREMRAWLAERGGKADKLPRDAFAGSGTSVSTRLLSIPARLPERASGLPLWMLEGVPSGDPVTVEDLHITRPLDMPVQRYRESGGTERVAAYAGECFGCQRVIWKHIDGHPHGEPATVWAACSGHHAADYGKHGPDVLLCFECYQDKDIHTAAYAQTFGFWTPDPAARQDYPVIYAGDLGAGMFAEVTGTDYRGWEFTFAGQLIADPEPLDGGYLVKLRLAGGADAELTVAYGGRVVLLDIPASEPGEITVSAPTPAPKITTAEMITSREPVSAAPPQQVLTLDDVPDIWSDLLTSLNG